MITDLFIKLALAQQEGLVPCRGIDCVENDLLKLGINIIQFMIDIALILGVLFFLIGGFLLLISGGSPNRIEQGKKAITGAIIGLVIVLTSVVVINTILIFLVDPKVCKVDSKAKVISIGKIECPGLFKEKSK